MSLVEKAIYELLKDTVANNQVYSIRAPQNVTGDFIVMRRTSSQRWRSINAPSGVDQVDLQIDAYSYGDYYTAKELGESIETILDGYSGTVSLTGTSPLETIKVLGITLQNDLDLIEQEEDNFLYRNLLNFLVTYEQ